MHTILHNNTPLAKRFSYTPNTNTHTDCLSRARGGYRDAEGPAPWAHCLVSKAGTHSAASGTKHSTQHTTVCAGSNRGRARICTQKGVERGGTWLVLRVGSSVFCVVCAERFLSEVYQTRPTRRWMVAIWSRQTAHAAMGVWK